MITIFAALLAAAGTALFLWAYRRWLEKGKK